MKLSLLKVVQTYLDYVDGFQVDSVFDSDEALQAATIAEHVYYTLLDKNRDGIPYTRFLGKLDSVVNPSIPNVLKIPESVTRINRAALAYNGHRVQYMHPEDFLKRYQVKQESDNTEEVEYEGVKLYINNKKQPDFFTTFDDTILVFDSYDSREDTTLHHDKSSVITNDHPVFLVQDNFYIPLPDHMMSGYQDLVIQECCEALRDIQKPQVARRANAFLAKLQKTSDRVGSGLPRGKRYGRR